MPTIGGASGTEHPRGRGCSRSAKSVTAAPTEERAAAPSPREGKRGRKTMKTYDLRRLFSQLDVQMEQTLAGTKRTASEAVL